MQRPSISDVLAELRGVSQRDGLSYSKTDKLQHIRKLPAVDASMLHNNRHPDDRGAVALEYVECVARAHHQLGEKYSALLCMALNIEPVSDLGLDDRVALFCESPYMSENSYKSHREKAFTRLAGTLVRLQNSPCDIDADREQEEQVRVEAAFRAKYDQETKSLIDQAWQRICFAYPDEHRDDALRRMIEALPGIAAMVGDEADEPFELVREMMRRVLQTEYPRWLDILKLETEYLGAEALLAALEVLGEFDGDVSLMVPKSEFNLTALRGEFSEIETQGSSLSDEDIDLLRSLGYTQVPDVPSVLDRPEEGSFVTRAQARAARKYQAELERSFGFALQILLSVEEAGGWSWIPRPDEISTAERKPANYL